MSLPNFTNSSITPIFKNSFSAVSYDINYILLNNYIDSIDIVADRNSESIIVTFNNYVAYPLSLELLKTISFIVLEIFIKSGDILNQTIYEVDFTSMKTCFSGEEDLNKWVVVFDVKEKHDNEFNVELFFKSHSRMKKIGNVLD